MEFFTKILPWTVAVSCTAVAAALVAYAATPVSEDQDSVKEYPKVTKVYIVDRRSDMVELIDSEGETWLIDGAEDWDVGDICAMIMSDAGTPDCIYDDRIIDFRFQRLYGGDD